MSVDKFFFRHSPDQKATQDLGRNNQWEGKKALAGLASSFLFVLAKPELPDSRMVSWRVVIITPALLYVLWVVNIFFSFYPILFLCRTIFISLIIDEDEDDNSYVAMALHFEVRLTCQGHTPRIMVLTKYRELIVQLWCWSTSSIFHKSVSKHAHCRIRKWKNLG
jgi:hypothetical protein